MKFLVYVNVIVAFSTLVMVEGFLSSLWEKLKKGLFKEPDETRHINHHITGDDDHDDANGLNLNKVWEPENRKHPKHYSVNNEILHPKVIEKNSSIIRVEFEEYNEKTKKLDEKYMTGNISTILVKENISSFVIDNDIVKPRRHHLDNGDLVIDNHVISHSSSSSLSTSSKSDANAPIKATNASTRAQPFTKATTSMELAPKIQSHNDTYLRGSMIPLPSHHDRISEVPAPSSASLSPPVTATHQKNTLSKAIESSDEHVFHHLWGMGHNKTHVGQYHRHHIGAGYEPYLPSNGKKYSTTEPKAHVSHDNYEKHIHQSLKDIDSGACKIVFIGDSVLSQINRDIHVRERLVGYHPINLASPGFRTEHILYRLTTSAHIGKIFEAPLFIVMIGTFNIGIHDTPDATKEGIMTVVGNIVKFSNNNSSRVVVCSILPRHSISLNKEIDQTNKLVASAIRRMDRIHFLNLDALFKGSPYPKKLLNDDLYMPDHLHPSENGYNKILNALRVFLLPFGDGAFQVPVGMSGDMDADVSDSDKKDKIIYGVSNTKEITQAEAAKMAAEAVARALGPTPTQVKPEDILFAARKRNALKTEKGKVINEMLKPIDKGFPATSLTRSTSSVDKPRLYSSSPTDGVMSAPSNAVVSSSDGPKKSEETKIGE